MGGVLHEHLLFEEADAALQKGLEIGRRWGSPEIQIGAYLSLARLRFTIADHPYMVKAIGGGGPGVESDEADGQVAGRVEGPAAWEMAARSRGVSLRALFGIAERPVVSGLAIGLLILGFARPAPATA